MFGEQPDGLFEDLLSAFGPSASEFSLFHRAQISPVGSQIDG
jgi:hypothetical protein